MVTNWILRFLGSAVLLSGSIAHAEVKGHPLARMAGAWTAATDGRAIVLTVTPSNDDPSQVNLAWVQQAASGSSTLTMRATTAGQDLFLWMQDPQNDPEHPFVLTKSPTGSRLVRLARYYDGSTETTKEVYESIKVVKLTAKDFRIRLVSGIPMCTSPGNQRSPCGEATDQVVHFTR